MEERFLQVVKQLILRRYAFEGWYLESNFNTKVTSNTTVTSEDSHSLYANWTSEPTITFTRNNSNVTVTCNSNSSYNLASFNVAGNNVSLSNQTTVSYNYEIGTCSSNRTTSITANCGIYETTTISNTSSIYTCSQSCDVPVSPEKYQGNCRCNFLVENGGSYSATTRFAIYSNLTLCATDDYCKNTFCPSLDEPGTVSSATASNCTQMTTKTFCWS